MFNPPTGPTNGAEYTYGNVVWQYQNPPGVWNIKDGTLVGTDGVGVSGFRLGGNDLFFYYVYPDGTTSGEINLGTVVGSGGGDVRIATSSLTGVASFPATSFSISSAGVVGVTAGLNTWTLVYGEGGTDTIRRNTTLTMTGGLGVRVIRNKANEMIVRGATAGTFTTIETPAGNIRPAAGFAAFNETQFSTDQYGGVSLLAGFSVTGDTVTGPNAAIKITKSGNLATIDARVAEYSLTGVASFNSTHFSLSNGAVSLSGAYATIGATGDTVTGPNAAIKITKSGNVATVDARVAEYSLTGVASFKAGDFVVTSGAVSLTSGIVNSVNGATGNLLVGAGDDKIVFTNPTGLTTSPNFVFDGTTLTFGGANTKMTVTGPDFAFGDLTKVKGGAYTMFSESATAFDYSGSNSDIIIDPRDGTIQKIKRTQLSGNIRVKLASSGWSTTPNTVQSIVVYLQQSGSSHTGEFDSSIIADRSVPMFGVTGGIDVFTISRYAVTNSTGLTMGFSIAVGLTGSGIAF